MRNLIETISYAIGPILFHYIIESVILDYIEDIFLNTEYSDLFDPELLEIELQNIYNTAFL